jgi:hypothetical protein
MFSNLSQTSDSFTIKTQSKQRFSFNAGFREKTACFKNLQITPDAIALLRGTELFEALDRRDNTIGIINVDADIAERQRAQNPRDPWDYPIK